MMLDPYDRKYLIESEPYAPTDLELKLASVPINLQNDRQQYPLHLVVEVAFAIYNGEPLDEFAKQYGADEDIMAGLVAALNAKKDSAPTEGKISEP